MPVQSTAIVSEQQSRGDKRRLVTSKGGVPRNLNLCLLNNWVTPISSKFIFEHWAQGTGLTFGQVPRTKILPCGLKELQREAGPTKERRHNPGRPWWAATIRHHGRGTQQPLHSQILAQGKLDALSFFAFEYQSQLQS